MLAELVAMSFGTGVILRGNDCHALRMVVRRLHDVQAPLLTEGK